MKKIFFCLILVLICICSNSTQTRTSNLSKNRTAAESKWPTFYSHLKAPAQGRNRDFVESVLTDEINCQDWDICKFTIEKTERTSDLVFRKWSQNNNRYWLELNRTLEKGKLEIRGSDVDEGGNELAWKWQYLKRSECAGFAIEFEFRKGSWKITEFSDSQSWCGH